MIRYATITFNIGTTSEHVFSMSAGRVAIDNGVGDVTTALTEAYLCANPKCNSGEIRTKTDYSTNSYMIFIVKIRELETNKYPMMKSCVITPKGAAPLYYNEQQILTNFLDVSVAPFMQYSYAEGRAVYMLKLSNLICSACSIKISLDIVPYTGTRIL